MVLIVAAYPNHRKRVTGAGFTLVELTVALLISALILVALSGVTGQSLNALESVRDETALRHELQHAMQRMVTAVERTRRVMVPKRDDPGTPLWNEADHDVLAVTMDPTLDRDFDGFADADNDEDGQIDEDGDKDATNDAAPGIYLIDDDNDGLVDVPGVFTADDDEDGTPSIGKNDEDPVDGYDNDGDGTVDEDFGGDMNFDGAPGIAGVDDDGDASVDEGSPVDDDEDGLVEEDWLDPVVFHLVSGDLVERMPNLNPTDGRDFKETVLFADPALFRVERIDAPQDRRATLRITLTGTLPDGTQQSIQRVVRHGVQLP